jgi:hypothetical protein
MYWQEILSLAIVAIVAIIFFISFVRHQQQRKYFCENSCGCRHRNFRFSKNNIIENKTTSALFSAKKV